MPLFLPQRLTYRKEWAKRLDKSSFSSDQRGFQSIKEGSIVFADHFSQFFLQAHDPIRRFRRRNDQPFLVDLMDQKDDGLAQPVNHRHMIPVAVRRFYLVEIKIENPLFGGDRRVKMLRHAAFLLYG